MSGDKTVSPALRTATDRLESWKEVAAYLSRDPRTVQRWERTEGLPVHRHLHGTLGSVYAYRSEIDGWRNQRDTISGSRSSGTAEEFQNVTALHKRKIIILVLPFENSGAEPGEEYFADGLTEELIRHLGRVRPAHLAVIARTTSMHYRGTRKTARQIAAEVRADYVLEGSLRRYDGRVLIEATLVHAKDQTQLWSEVYERKQVDLPTVQHEVITLITQSLKVELLPDEVARLSGGRRILPEAYEDYLRGRYFWNQRSSDGFAQAIKFFERSLAKDRRQALSHAGLADVYGAMAFYSWVPSRRAYPKSREHALCALERDDSLPDAHASLAVVLYGYDYDWAAAEIEFQRALEIDANSAAVHHRYSIFLILQGRVKEAQHQIELARALDPLSVPISSDQGLNYFYAGEYEKAQTQARRTMELDPHAVMPQVWLARSLGARGNYGEAIRQLKKTVRMAPRDLLAQAFLGHLLGVAGQVRAARGLLQRLQSQSKKRYVAPTLFCMILIGMGELEKAMRWQRAGFAQRDVILTRTGIDPIADPLRGLPDFEKIMSEMGMVSSRARNRA